MGARILVSAAKVSGLRGVMTTTTTTKEREFELWVVDLQW
jgi:hypothetical protein